MVGVQGRSIILPTLHWAAHCPESFGEIIFVQVTFQWLDTPGGIENSDTQNAGKHWIPTEQENSPKILHIGFPCPCCSGTCFPDSQGFLREMTDFVVKVAFLRFWVAWSPHCPGF